MNSGTVLPAEGSDDPYADSVIVTGVDVHVDPLTLDRIFVVHSEATKPLTLRVPALDMPGILQSLADAVTRAMN